MVFEIGVNLRVTECLDKGDRNYMEDFSKCYFEKVNGSIVFGFFGIFDGHGGSEAARFAKKILINEIKKISQFWSENDDDVLSAIKQGFINTHQLMWKERDNWSKTISGFDSTAGTTVTIAIVRNRKLYIGHVGDSACVLGCSKIVTARTDSWEPMCLTVEHKPSNLIEKKRIEKFGGMLAKKCGVQRVVWNRPKHSNNKKDIVEGDSVEYEKVPFLAVTRSLGDLWSYDQNQGVYHISPEPDVKCIPLDSTEHRCFVLGSDGLWNVVPVEAAIELVRICERETERRVFLDPNIDSNFFYNPAASLVKYSISQWKRRRIRADNVSALVVMIDPPGPSMTKRREDRRKSNFIALDILSSLTCDIPTNENFSKQLTKEYLIECNRWRSANEVKLKNEPDMVSVVHLKSSLEFDDLEGTAKSLCLTTSNISKKPQEIGFLSTNKSTLDTLINKIPLISDPSYLNCCISWINNYKVWYFLTEYFVSIGLNSENGIINFLNSINQNLSKEILRIMPWIYVAKTSFKVNSHIYQSLSKVPLFSEFWLELYKKFIKPLEKSCLLIQISNMQAIINAIKMNILALLKQYNYLIARPFMEKFSLESAQGENNENSEIQKKSHNNNKGKSLNSSKTKCYLSAEQRNRVAKLVRLVQSEKKRLLKEDTYLPKRSLSEKHVISEKSKVKSYCNKLGSPSDSEITYKHTDHSNCPIRRRYSALIIGDTVNKPYLLSKSNTNAMYKSQSINDLPTDRMHNKNC